MGKFFSVDSPLYRFASRLTDILILNLLWILCSIPIFTIGAATTAVYYVNLKMIKNEEVYIVRSFFKSFKENFKQSTIMWLIYLFAAIVLATDYYYLFQISEKSNIVLKGITVLATILYLFAILYAFPLQARYENPIKRTIFNSIIISIRYFKRTIIIIGLLVVITFIGLYTTTTLIFAILFGVGILSYVVTAYVLKIFEEIERKNIEVLNEEQEDKEQEDKELEDEELEDKELEDKEQEDKELEDKELEDIN